jgi:uncharacterized protein
MLQALSWLADADKRTYVLQAGPGLLCVGRFCSGRNRGAQGLDCRDGASFRSWPHASPRRTPKDVISMPIVSASVPTVNAAKYIQQLCKHWSHKLPVDLSVERGVVRFPDAVVAFEARADDLMVTIDSPEKAAVERMKDVVASHLDRFAFREAPLRFVWSQPDAA